MLLLLLLLITITITINITSYYFPYYLRSDVRRQGRAWVVVFPGYGELLGAVLRRISELGLGFRVWGFRV